MRWFAPDGRCRLQASGGRGAIRTWVIVRIQESTRSLFEKEGYWSLIGEGFRGSGVAVIPGVATWMDRGGCTLLRVIASLMSDVFGYFLPVRGAG